MIDFLRKKVSGHKIRYQESGFDLDLSYITSRVIAMSLPGEGLQRIYRNSIDSVARFLKEKHGSHYQIINLSGHRYDYEKFSNKVSEYLWEDHYPPSILLLFQACEEMHRWLYSDKENVIAVNCKAGKGRTGTLICCYLIFSGRLASAEEALVYYKRKRFAKGGGVTQPSQVRYVYYFASIFSGNVKSPNLLYLENISLKTFPHIGGNGCRLVFEMIQKDRLVYSNKKASRDRQNYFQDDWEMKKMHLLETVQSKVLIQGDLQCNLTSWGFKMRKICRFTFNTAFVDDSLEVQFNKRALDPDSFRKSRDVDEDFCVFLRFSKVCQCSSHMSLAERCESCESCSNLMEKEEFHQWICIKQILFERIPISASILLFTDPELDDVEEILKKSQENPDLESDGSAD
jgi:phosphatidylinositol-3,4,5-trisphosphate 3-phosphatase/dual-specificity protein phosphatase PTEN